MVPPRVSTYPVRTFTTDLDRIPGYRNRLLAYRMAVPGSRPLIISADNKRERRASSLAEAFGSGQAFAIEVREEIIPIDLDSDRTCVEDLEAYLIQQEIPHLTCRSGGTTDSGMDRHHVYLWVPDSQERSNLLNVLKQWIGGESVRYKQLMRPPGSPHRSGSGVAMPISARQAQRFLERLPRYAAADPRSWPDDVAQFIIRGPVNDRSTYDLAVVWKLVLMGYDDSSIIELAYSGEYPFSDKAREYGVGTPSSLKYLERTIGKVRRKVGERRFSSRGEVDAWLSRALVVIDNSPSSLFGSRMTRRIFVACIAQFRRLHTIETALSSRSIAMEAQVARGTAEKHLKRLVQDGWLLKIQPSSPGTSNLASVYRLNVPKIDPRLGSHPRDLVVDQMPELPSNPMFNRGFLNESGRAVVNVMKTGASMSRKELIEATGLSSSTLHDTLRRLMAEPYLLVERSGHGRYRRTDRLLSEVEHATEAESVSAHREQMFQGERHSYGRYLLDRGLIGLDEWKGYAGWSLIQESESASEENEATSPIQSTHKAAG